MLTVLDVINKSTEYLDKKGIESARMNAEMLLADILKCKRLELYLMFDRPLTENQLTEYREYLKRRSLFEPVQYIIGCVEFYGLDFYVSPDVLIPRPETEFLVESIINSLDKNEEIKILDIGSGSGNISISLAANLEEVYVTGIEISEAAIQIANKNLNKFEFNDRVNFVNADIFKLDENQFTGFDVIVSNPPYVSKKDFMKVQKEIKDYEPDIAVTDFGDGFKFYDRIISFASNVLKQRGKLFFELALGQSEILIKKMHEQGFEKVNIVKDYQKIDRIIYGVKN